MRKEKITRKEYIDLAHKFNPVKFNAEEWILHAKKAGMKYFIITAKHHDGFALYDSKVSDFDIIDQTPFKRDPMDELAKAARKHGIKFGFYYSHAFDWEHPGAPGNDWEYKNPGGDLNLSGGRDWFDVHPELLPKAVKYIDEKAIPQIKELIARYRPDILWFDTPHKLPLSENIRILKAIRETDPNVVVNGRLVRSANANFGDYKNTADRPAEFYPAGGYWESIPTTNESYGYHQFDKSHKPATHFIRLLANAASRGGNLLMNIGPKGDGSFDEKDLQILNGIGAWINKNKESIFEVSASSLPKQSWGVSTMKDNRLYLHVFNWPADGKLYVGGLKNNVTKAFSLADPQKQFLTTRINANDVLVMLPKHPIDTTNTVLVIDLQNKLQTDTVRYVATNILVTRLLAFDATQQGKAFSFGDGKTDRYYVEGWKRTDQVLTWDFRTSTPADYKVVIKYLAPAETCGGVFALSVNGYHLQDTVITGSGVITRELGTVSFGTLINNLKIIPLDIAKTELMKLLEVQLISLNLGNRTE